MNNDTLKILSANLTSLGLSITDVIEGWLSIIALLLSIFFTIFKIYENAEKSSNFKNKRK
jgi:uncharacterized membrane protein YoaK (UPF0700 family)